MDYGVKILQWLERRKGRCLKKGFQLQNRFLINEIGGQEIEEVINQCGETKSPSLDCFNFLFLRHNGKH